MSTMFIEDKPIQNPEDDILGYDKFAKDIADLIANQPQNANFVMSINGEWGQGKSSCINLVKYYLTENYNKKVVYADFSPWFFNGEQEALLRDFFHVLYKSINTLFDTIKDKGNKTYEEFNTLLRCLSLNCNFKTPISGLEAGVSLDFNNLPKKTEPTLTEIKDCISSKLKNSLKKIVIFIDDLDRLNKSEILQIFSLIKSVADFPNIIYVLSCDKNVLCNILQQHQGIDGEKYLEKIVQIQFDLPIAETKFLKNMLLKDIDWGNSENEHSILRIYYQHGLKQIINHPRKVKRFRQHFDILYPKVKDEVCVADFYAIIFLKLFAPKSYNLIKENIGWLAMPDTIDRVLYSLSDINGSKFKETADLIIKTLQDENPSVLINDWRYFIENMFPNIKLISNNQVPKAGYSLSDFKLKRIFCSDLCWGYFKFNYYNHNVRKSDFDNMLKTIKKEGDFDTYINKNIELKKYDEQSLSFRLLNALRYDYQKDIPLDKLDIIIQDLLSIGFKYDNDYDISYDFFGRGTFSSIAKILVSIYFGNIENTYNRSKKLLSIISDIDIGFLCYYIQFDEKFWGNDNIIHIKEAIVEKINDNISNLLNNKGLMYILSVYNILCPDNIKKLLDAIADTDNKKIILIKSVCPEYIGGMLYTNSIYKHKLIKDLASSINKENISKEENDILEEYFNMLSKN